MAFAQQGDQRMGAARVENEIRPPVSVDVSHRQGAGFERDRYDHRRLEGAIPFAEKEGKRVVFGIDHNNIQPIVQIQVRRHQISGPQADLNRIELVKNIGRRGRQFEVTSHHSRQADYHQPQLAGIRAI